MARLAWQNVDAPNLAPAMQGFKNVTDLLDKALASTQGSVEDQLKLRKYQDDVLKAKNDANTLAANRAINAKVAMSPSAQALQQSLQNGSLLGEDYLDASPEVILGARTAVGDMLTNSLNQDKVSALEPNRKIAWIRQQYANDPVGYEKAMASMLSPETYNASPEAIGGIATGLADSYKQNQLEVTDANKKFATDLYGQISAMGLPKADQLNFMQSEAYRLNATPGQLGAMALLAKEQGLSNEPIVAPATTGKTGTTPAGTALGNALTPPIDYTGSSVNLGVMRNTYNNRPLPENINTLGDLFDNKKSEYFRGTDKKLHTPTGPLQILADTFARHGEKIYGKNWREQSLNDPKVHYDIGESIFKETGGDVDKLMGQWEALKKLPRSTVEQIAKSPWDKAAPIIAAAESGGGTSGGAANSMRLGLNDYGKTQVDNFKGRASRYIAQISADPLVANYTKLDGSLRTPDEVAWDGVKTSVDYGTLNKDDMDSAAKNIKRTILDIQKRSGNTISADLAFEVAKQAFGDENFRTLWLDSDLNLDDGKVDKILKGIKDKGGYADQARNLEKLNLGLSKLNAAEDKFNLAQQRLSEFSQRTAGNGYSEPARQQLEAERNLARERLSEITKTMEDSRLYEPKENVTEEQELTNAAEEKKALVDGIIKTKLDLKAANDFVRTGKRTPASDAVAQSLQVTNPADVKPVARPIPVPVKVDGKSGTGTTFALDSKTGQAVPVTPLKLDPNVKYLKPVTVVKADRSGGQKGVITYVGDGDGANVDVGGSTIKCRLDTFDAPETGGSPKKWPDQPYSREAENKLKSLIASGEVTVIVSKPADTSSPPSGKNNYGRSLCKIEVQGKNVDQEMLRSGAAWLRLEYATDEKLINLFNTAKSSKTGLFADPNAVPPWDYRKSFK